MIEDMVRIIFENLLENMIKINVKEMIKDMIKINVKYMFKYLINYLATITIDDIAKTCSKQDQRLKNPGR